MLPCALCRRLQVTCSEGGVCLADLSAGLGGAAAAQPQVQAAQPPTIRLVTTVALPAAVSIRQGTLYAACAAGQAPTADLPCELGVVAAAAAGSDGAAGANLTGDVLACPPASCLGSRRCPQVGWGPADLPQHKHRVMHTYSDDSVQRQSRLSRERSVDLLC